MRRALGLWYISASYGISVIMPGDSIMESEAVHVTNGMEMLSWVHDNDEWAATLATLERGYSRDQSDAGTSFLPGFALTVMVSGVAVLIEPVAAISTIVVGTAVSFLAANRRFFEPRFFPVELAEYRNTPPPVSLTSTGVSFGRYACRWRGDGYVLTAAELTFEPPCLVLSFSPYSGVPSALHVPVPRRLLVDVREISERLQERIRGMPSGHPRSPGE